jgi:NADPH:quinone reductase-like Zn-dependent oxidoreductase
MEKMQAVVYDKTNKPDKLSYCEVDKPVPTDSQILVKIYAVSVNAADYRSMNMGMIPKKKIFGADIAGRVESIGKNIQHFKIGDEVLGDLASFGFGGFAEYAVAPEKALVLKPANLSFDVAAALPMASVTALQGLRDKKKIQQGQSVLIHGGGGGVGTFAIQLAKYFGAIVTVVCSSKNVDQSRSLGADFVIDYSKEDFLRIDRQYDLILAINGNRSLIDYKHVLKSDGQYVMIGGSLSQIFKSLLFGWFMSIGSKKMSALAAKPDQKDLEFLTKLAVDGLIKPVIDSYYSLEQATDAVRYISEGHASGKIIIKVN